MGDPTTAPDRPVVLVTGASRGIGRATAVAFARAGFDVVAAGRTLVEGQHHEQMLTTATGAPLAGSLESTVAAVREAGAEAHAVAMDLLDAVALQQVAEQAVAFRGRVDVVVHNATYHGEAVLQRVLDATEDDLTTVLRANVVGPLTLTRSLLPHLLERERAVIIVLTSDAGSHDPPLPVDAGGWSFAYGASKGALQRLVGVLAVELPDTVLPVNLQPGIVRTESLSAALGDDGALEQALGAAPPEVPARVALWLATDAEAAAFRGRTVHAQPFARERALVPGWP
ncbi:MAG: SDR family oxidoreductase [Acidimicrobiales bacterium]|nr:SDR family oxidoreductase [Acidimicrobiales bacterium]